jgi:protein involved in polysaccharide export with SLBB domain
VGSNAIAQNLTNAQKLELLQKASQKNTQTQNAPDKIGPSATEMEKRTLDQLAPPAELSTIEKMLNQDHSTTEFSPRIATETVKVQTNDSVRQFGYDAFQGGGGQNGPTEGPASPDYVLGAGDALLIRVWGKVEEQFAVTIDNNGQVYLPKVGILTLAGVRYGNLNGAISRELSKYYVNFKVSATLSSMRSIKVFILGEVKFPGAYDMSAMSTVMTALYSSGGPTKMGSLRKVQLMRNKKVVKTIDLYDYLLSGNRGQDSIVQNFDTIFVPVIGNVVKVTGHVKRPGIYELKGNESLEDAIQLFGSGFGMTYYGKQIQVDRIIEGKNKVITDISLPEGSKKTAVLKKEKLRNGDIVNVLPIKKKRFNEVSIQGNVNRPGTFEFHEGMRLKDLISKSDGLLLDTYMNRMEIYRAINESEYKIIPVDYTKAGESDIELKEFDVVRVHAKKDIKGKETVSAQGKFQSPGTYQLLENMKVLDLVYLALPQKTADVEFAELVRKDVDGKETVISINIESLKANPNHEKNLTLKDGDRLFVRESITKTELRTVTLTGEFVHPGTYSVQAGEKLIDVIKRAGGLTPKAFLDGLVFKRKSVKQQADANRTKVVSEEQKKLLFDDVRIKTLSNLEYKTAYGDALAAIQNDPTLNEGRLVLDLSNLSDTENYNNITLKNEDEIFIPELPSSVAVIGGVQQTSSQIFVENRDANYYIQMAGGFSQYANPSDMLIIKANGRVIRGGGLGIQIQRGDSIFVPEEIKVRFDFFNAMAEFGKFLANIATAFAFYNTIK